MNGAADKLQQCCERARSLLHAGQYDDAVGAYQAALGIDPNAPDVYYGLGTAMFLKGDLQRAVDAFQEVVRLDPKRAGAYVNMGAAFNRMDRPDKAVECLLRSVKIGPPIAEAYYNLGIAYRKSDELGLAIDAYREATAISPTMVDAHLNLANLYLAIRRYREAISHYRRVLELRPDFERAKAALEQAEAERAQAAARLRRAAGAETPVADSKPPVIHRPSERERLQLQSRLREAVTNCTRFSGEYAVYLENVLEPTVQRLSRCLLHADTAPDEVEQSVAAFESALNDGRLVHKSLAGTIGAMRRAATEMLGGQ